MDWLKETSSQASTAVTFEIPPRGTTVSWKVSSSHKKAIVCQTSLCPSLMRLFTTVSCNIDYWTLHFSLWISPFLGHNVPGYFLKSFHHLSLMTASIGQGDPVTCCGLHATSHLCFELLSSDGENSGAQSLMAFTCLPARAAISRR